MNDDRIAIKVWTCHTDGCDRQVHGMGVGWGLLAIGWYYTYETGALCPEHHPMVKPCPVHEDEPLNLTPPYSVSNKLEHIIKTVIEGGVAMITMEVSTTP